MQCADVDLIAFHDDELLPDRKQEVQLHLNRCESCRKELGSIDSTMTLLSQYWGRERAGCPPTEQIVSYHEGALRARPREAVRVHLADCSSCEKLVELLDHLGEGPAFDELEETPEPLPARVRTAVHEARRESLAARLKKSLEAVVAEGKEHLRKAPGAVTQMVDDLMAPRETGAAPNLAAPKNAAEVEPGAEQEGGTETDGNTKTGRRGKKDTGGQGDKGRE